MKELFTRAREGPILPSADFLNRYNEADINLDLKKVEDQLSGPKYGGQYNNSLSTRYSSSIVNNNLIFIVYGAILRRYYKAIDY